MICCLIDSASPPGVEALADVACACSPRVEPWGTDAVVFDVQGLDRVIGPPHAIAEEVERLAIVRGLRPRIAIAGTMTAAWLLARYQARPTVAPPGQEARAVADLPLGILQALGSEHPHVPDLLSILFRWGLRTLGDLARLPEADVRTRLGPTGARLHQIARGLDDAPLVPAEPPVRFMERLELEWPIDGLEPLSFVLARLCDALSSALERADRGAVAITTRLRLTTRTAHLRTLTLPAPMRESRVLRTLILLDLESHPPPAAIDIVEVELGVTPGPIVQGSLLTRALPPAEQIATLVARLGALMGESRVGSPDLVDTHDERAVGMKIFALPDQGKRQKASSLLPSAFCLLPCFRRFRLPIAASVDLDRGAPACVRASSRDLAGGRVLERAGPWRSSGRWWALDASEWDRDHWTVALPDGLYALARDRTTGRWVIEGVVD